MSTVRRKSKRRKSQFTFLPSANDADFDEFDSGQIKKPRKVDFKRNYGYDVKDKLIDPLFDVHTDSLLKRLDGKDFTVKYCQETGFEYPILFESPDGLDIKMPKEKFSVQNVQKLLGADRVLDVMDVVTQKGMQMSLKKFVSYYKMPLEKRKKLWNVLSLEFSNTKLSKFVQAPKVIKELDWVELAWPKDLLHAQIDETNAIVSMKYPKVQNYCLMSVADCFTDFHVDFGGTSVWYHILKGEKIFWLAPPTDDNLQRYKEWTLTGQQQAVFFGDLVEQCIRIRLKVGNTFMIPSGWIHAVYTPVDSLVFGGNFLHSFAIPMQLRIFQLENNTRVPKKFRYPFFQEMQWFLAERYFYALTGVGYRKKLTTPIQQQQNLEQSQLLSEKAKNELKTDEVVLVDKQTIQENDNIQKQFNKSEDAFVDSVVSTNNSPILLHDLPKITIPENPAFIVPSKLEESHNQDLSTPKFQVQLSPVVSNTDNDSSSLHYSPDNLHKLTKFELNGLKSLLKFLNLPDSKRHVPDRIRDAEILLLNLKDILQNCQLIEDPSTLEGRTIINPVSPRVEPVIKSKALKTKRRKMIQNRVEEGGTCNVKLTDISSNEKPTDFLDNLLNEVVSNVMCLPNTSSADVSMNLSESSVGSPLFSSQPQIIQNYPSITKVAYPSITKAAYSSANFDPKLTPLSSPQYLQRAGCSSTSLPAFNVFLNNNSSSVNRFLNPQQMVVEKATQQLMHLEQQQQQRQQQQQQAAVNSSVSRTILDPNLIRYIGSTAILNPEILQKLQQKTPYSRNVSSSTSLPPPSPISPYINFNNRIGEMMMVQSQQTPVANNNHPNNYSGVYSNTTSLCSTDNTASFRSTNLNTTPIVECSMTSSKTVLPSVVSDLSNLMHYCETVLQGRHEPGATSNGSETSQPQFRGVSPSVKFQAPNQLQNVQAKVQYINQPSGVPKPNHQFVLQRLADRFTSLPRPEMQKTNNSYCSSLSAASQASGLAGTHFQVALNSGDHTTSMSSSTIRLSNANSNMESSNSNPHVIIPTVHSLNNASLNETFRKL